jgi:hypothetical protein
MNAWTHDEMISETVAWWGREDRDAEDCKVIEREDERGKYLVVLHEPSGTTSEEAGDAGRWQRVDRPRPRPGALHREMRRR